MVFSTAYNACLSKSKRVLLGLLQNLEMCHPRQQRLNHMGSYEKCRAIIAALPRLTLFQVCQINSNKFFLGVVLSSMLLRLFFCAIGTAVRGVGGMLPSLDTFGPIFPFRILPVSLVLTHRARFGIYGHNASLASHETFYEA